MAMNADVHALAGAYALHALPTDEATAFEAHLADCSPCRTEVAELRVTASQLGVAVAEEPPSRIRAAVLRAASETRQLPPRVRPTESAGRWRTARGWLAAAAAVVVVAGGVWIARDVTDEPTETDPIAAVVGASDAEVATVDLRGGGAMTVISSERLEQAVVLSEDLPRTRSERVYQLWYVDPSGTARSADLLVEAPGTAAVVRGLRSGDQVAITREPAGGSEQPTMAPLAITDPV